MQSRAEKELICHLRDYLNMKQNDYLPPLILNIGGGRSLVIEKELFGFGCNYICDRIDIDDCSVVYPTVRHCWINSVEEMALVNSNEYSASFANYVLEHVPNLYKASCEIFRILSPSGIFVASLPNTTAPEFVLAKRTPLWFHRIVRRAEAWETHYSYKSIPELIEIFKAAGFILQDVKYWPVVGGYLQKYPIANVLGRLYDRIISLSKISHLMGSVCITFKKPS